MFDTTALLQRNEITLADDGYENGSFCVEYWVELYEKIGGVCLAGSRMTAAEILAYFRTDPDAAYAVLPQEETPFPMGAINLQTMAQSLTLHDPPPHICAVTGRAEVGVVAPSALLLSEALTAPPEVTPSSAPEHILPLP